MNLQSITDKAAISVSALCVIHCLATPLLLVLAPSLASLNLESEAFHRWLLVVVIPTSLVALFLGCKKHRRFSLMLSGFAGITLLVLAAILGHDRGELWEKTLTIFGACIIALAHIQNYKLCREADHLCCDAENTIRAD